jgi:hypothetical protein
MFFEILINVERVERTPLNWRNLPWGGNSDLR